LDLRTAIGATDPTAVVALGDRVTKTVADAMVDADNRIGPDATPPSNVAIWGWLAPARLKTLLKTSPVAALIAFPLGVAVAPPSLLGVPRLGSDELVLAVWDNRDGAALPLMQGAPQR